MVLQAKVSKLRYQELDYVNARTHLVSRWVQLTSGHAKTYRVVARSTAIRQSIAPVETPACQPPQSLEVQQRSLTSPG